MTLNRLVGTDGETLPHDDKLILPASLLIRTINIEEHVCFDENRQVRRLKSAAFSRTGGDPHYGMSVDLNQLLERDGLPPDHKVPGGMAAVQLRVKDVRALGLAIGSDPIDGSDGNDANEYHGQVWGVRDTKRAKLQSVALGWVVPIPGVEIR